MITITFDKDRTLRIEPGLTLAEILAELPERPRRPVAALVNGVLQEMDYPIYIASGIEWLDTNCNMGWRIYRRSLIFLLRLAVRELFPERALYVSHSLSEGLFCWLRDASGQRPSAKEIKELEERMREYVAEDLPISRTRVAREDAAAFFRSRGELATALQVERLEKEDVTLYQARGLRGYTFGKMVTSAGYLDCFHVLPYEDGLVVNLPARSYLGCSDRIDFLHKQLQSTLAEYHEWSELMGVRTASELNEVVRRGDDEFTNLVLIAETMQERNLHRISDKIYSDFPKVRLVLLAGPSSSGKTTTARRLAIQFRTMGVHPVMISLDDYFVDRSRTPLNELGNPDYEGIAALDIELFQQNMHDLLEGREAALPRYDFKRGSSHKNDRRLHLAENQILLVEGIHALNETLSSAIPGKNKRKVFVSALTQLNLDEYTPVSASDNRLVRRIVRDIQFRGVTPEDTLEHWDEVRRGEHRNIFPHQEGADFFLNSVLIYELPVLRPLLESLLVAISPERRAYLEAQRLLQLIRSFDPAPSDAVPRHSILREFIGNSIFKQ